MRFPGFSDEWRKTTLGNNCEIQMCKRILAQQTNPDDGVPFFKIGTIGGKPDAYISSELFNQFKEKYNYPQKGEVLISCAGTVGRCVRFDGKPAYFQDSNIVWPRNNQNTYTNDFLYYILSKQNWRHLNTTTIIRIYNDDLRSLKFSHPSIEEQQKITSLLSAIDKRIATQNKIIEDLKKLKSAIYDVVFSSLTGRLASLGDVAEIIKGKQVNGEFLSDDGEYYVMNGGVEPSGYYHSFNTPANTISISEGGNSCGYIQWNNSSFWSGGHCYTLRILDSNIENKYLYHLLKRREVEIMKLRIGTGLPNIQKKDLAKVSVVMPSSAIQNKVISLLDSIDNKIKIEINLSFLFLRQKAYLLSKMFI